MIQTANALFSPHATNDLLSSPELSFLDYFNFKETEDRVEENFKVLENNKSDHNKLELSSDTPICCGEAFFSVQDFMNHFEAEHKNGDFPPNNQSALAGLRSDALTPSLQTGLSQISIKNDEDYGQNLLLPTIEEAEEPIIVAAPTAKRSRIISVSQGNKKVKESIDDLALILDEWNTPAIDANNMGYIDQPSSDFPGYFDSFNGEDERNISDYGLPTFESDPIPSRSYTSPPYVGYKEQWSTRRISTYSIDDTDSTKRYECPRPFCSKVYKNTNGLKYHLERGNCEVEGDELTGKLENDGFIPGEIKVANRPYFCKMDGCGKKYKNLNGLKYHAKISHPRIDFKSQVKGCNLPSSKV